MDDQEQTPSETTKTERVIAFAYGVVDATFVDYLEFVIDYFDRPDSVHLSIERISLSAASSRYILTLGKHKIPATILIRMVGVQHTHCAVEGGTPELRAFVWQVLSKFIGHIYGDQVLMRQLIDEEPQRVKDFAQADRTVDDMLAEFPSFPRRSDTKKSPGPPRLKVNDWALQEVAAGKTIDDLLPEYARRRRLKNMSEARELLRKAVKQTKRK
jgi:hypothetical protein